MMYNNLRGIKVILGQDVIRWKISDWSVVSKDIDPATRTVQLLQRNHQRLGPMLSTHHEELCDYDLKQNIFLSHSMDPSIKFQGSAVINRLESGSWQPIQQNPLPVYITRGPADQQARLLIQQPSNPNVWLFPLLDFRSFFFFFYIIIFLDFIVISL